MTNKKLQVWLPFLLSAVMALGMLAGYKLSQNNAWKDQTVRKGKTSALEQVMDLVQLRYVDSIALDSIEADAIETITSQLDPHSIYISSQHLGEVNDDLQGNFSGIGVEYQIINDTITVVYVLEKGPSGVAGIQAGDRLLKADTSQLSGVKIDNRRLRGLLRGKPGSKVTMTLLQTDGKQKQVEITRGSIPLPSVDASYMAGPGVGYIRLNRFSETTFKEFMDAATGLEKAGMTKMILDLRGNGGGLLEQATHIADELLIDGKLLVSTRGNNVKTKEILSTKPGIFEKGPLVILMDEFSASASEVLAGALQDNDRGTIIGRRSFGKGLVQEQYDLKNGGALRLTIARYYTPTGRSIQKPYTRGQKDKYRDEIMDRYQNGDSAIAVVANGKAFTTRGGKKVYEGGGISPDQTIAFDSTIYSKEVETLFKKNLLIEYAFNVFQKNRDAIKKFGSANNFDRQYILSEEVWQGLVKYAVKDSINLSNLPTGEKTYLSKRLKALIARYVWRNTGYYEVLNQGDPFVEQALLKLATP